MQITTQETAAYSAVLEKNDQGDYTAPADLYPHQWLWDSCFIAIGLRHTDPDRAAKELKSILRGQWSNGMLPNMIFKSDAIYRVDRRIWRSKISGQAPKHVATSGITQPPMLAQAVLLVGEKLEAEKQKLFFEHMLKPIIKYHEWLYNERDPHHEGLILQIHPYETGLNNTSPWTKQLYEHEQPWWILVVSRLRLITIINFLRRDVRGRNPGQRMKSTEALILWSIIQRFKRKRYKISKILKHSLLSMQDVTFNSILRTIIIV